MPWQKKYILASLEKVFEYLTHPFRCQEKAENVYMQYVIIVVLNKEIKQPIEIETANSLVSMNLWPEIVVGDKSSSIHPQFIQ